jgi:predicted ATPase/signal transduction histidine kinase
MQDSSPRYALGEKLSQGRRASVYRATRNADGHKVVLRVLDAADPFAANLERFKHELNLKPTLRGLPAVQPLAISTLNGYPALELEDSVGEPLERLVGAPLSVDDFLPLAISVAAAIADIHACGLIHKDLNPGSILFDPQTRRVKIDNFGVASRVVREQTPAGPERLLEESLPYVSPEQTGRMNRAVDSRSDLYSLGVIYYQLLTGRLPFRASDAIGWVHCHVARKPAPPARIRASLPSVLSEIVLKLLAKVPDDRYQSASGLKRDLERCLRQWRETGVIAQFSLAAEDASERFLVPQTVYGREAECTLLRSAFERVATTGRPELVWLSGPSGIGKSAVVYELRRPIIRRQSFFIAAKFERGKREIPYLAVIRAFRELTLDILAGSADEIATWRDRIIDALGPYGRLIIDILPELELVIGLQPEPPELPLAEAQNRLRRLLRRFVRAFARPEHPLTLFLDDLQWGDDPSVNLVADLMTDAETRNFLLVAASRTDEPPRSEALAALLDKVRASGAIVSTMVLAPLAGNDVDRLVADTLHRSIAEAAPLARLVRDKTGGNPFFAIHFLTALYSKRLITFDRATSRWTWDMARVGAEQTTDNVVDLMVAKLRRLPRPTQEALSLAAHIGAFVDGPAMTAVLGRDPDPVLAAAVEEDLILRIDHACRFPHDRVQEAAYSLVPERERAGLHLEIGRRLWAQTPAAEREERPFEIATQLNQGASLIASREERQRVAEINLSAGKRAKASAAYTSALTYLAAGCALLSEENDCGWERRYELTFALELNRAECEHLSGDSAVAEKRLSLLSRRARTLIDHAAVTCVAIEIYQTTGRPLEAIEAALDYLRRVGVAWSTHPTEAEVEREYALLWEALGERSIESLVDLPPIADPECRATMDVLLASTSPALITDPNLHDLMFGRTIILSLARGNSDASCMAYIRFGCRLGPHLGDYEKGYRFGKLGLDLVEQHGFLRFEAQVYRDFGALVMPWTKHLPNGLALIRRSATVAEETGNISDACYARTCIVTRLLAQGDPLPEAQREAEEALIFTKRVRFESVADIIDFDVQLIRMLRGLLPRFGSLTDAAFDEESFESRLRDPRWAVTACWYWIRKLQARFHANDFAGAVEAADHAAPLLWTSPEFLETAEYHFYGALARAGRHDEVAPAERAGHREALLAHGRQLATWARHCPENFRNRAALVEAEIARIEGRPAAAEHLYEEALTSARENGFVHNEAVAFEVAGRFWRARGHPIFGDAYLREACERYRRWGAEGKVRQLSRIHPQLASAAPLSLAEARPTSADQLDLLAVIKASQTISGAMGRDELVRTLLQIVVEQGGARRAHLVRVQDGELEVAADMTLGQDEEAGEPPPTPDADLAARDPATRVPVSILRYVARTQERVLLDDAAADPGRFASDVYLASARPRSVLCLPIRRERRVAALLYLENDLAPGVFTAERLVALELIAAQAAISLENSLLLVKTQRAVQLRDQFLSVASHELRTPITSLRLTLESMVHAARSSTSQIPARVSARIDRLLHSAQRLQRLVDELLDVARIEQGQAILWRTEVDLGALVRSVAEQLEFDLAQAGCHLSIDSPTRAVGFWDAPRLERVVTNLLGNAIKFGAGRPIEVALCDTGQGVELTVKDHGIGIPADRITKIFDRFERAVSNAHYGGLGLGLYLARSIVESHGGTIDVMSREGEGSTFEVRLPRARRPDRHAKHGKHAKHAATGKMSRVAAR